MARYDIRNVAPEVKVRKPRTQASCRDKAVLCLEMRGYRNTQIARTLGLHRLTVAEIKRHPAYLAELERVMELGAAEAMLRLGPKALRALDEALQCGDPALGLKAASFWFDRMDAMRWRWQRSAEDCAAEILAESGARAAEAVVEVDARRQLPRRQLPGRMQQGAAEAFFSEVPTAEPKPSAQSVKENATCRATAQPVLSEEQAARHRLFG